MEIKIELNEDLVHQGLNMQLVRETSCKHNTSVEQIHRMKKQLQQADAHWQRQLGIMEHTMNVLQRRMDAFKKRNPDF